MVLIKALLVLIALAIVPFVSGAALRDRADGFVATSGQKFVLNGDEFIVAGTNAYWLAQQSDEDIDTALSDIAAAGLTAVRTW